MERRKHLKHVKFKKKDPQSIPPLYCRCIQVTVGHTWGKQPARTSVLGFTVNPIIPFFAPLFAGKKKHLPKSHQIPNIPISMKSAIVCHKLPQNEPDKFLAKFPMARGLAPKVAFTSRSAEGIDSIPDVPPPASMDGLEIQ